MSQLPVLTMGNEVGKSNGMLINGRGMSVLSACPEEWSVILSDGGERALTHTRPLCTRPRKG